MMKRHPLTMAVAILLLQSSAAFAWRYQKYCPIEQGNEWTFSPKDSMLAITEEHGDAYFMEGLPGFPQGVWLVWGGNTLYAWNKEKGAWQRFLRFGAPVGTSYKVNLGTEFWTEVWITVHQKDLVAYDPVVREEIKDCVRFEIYKMHVADMGTTELVFGPTIGLVKWTDESFAGPRETWLMRAALSDMKYGLVPLSAIDAGTQSQFHDAESDQVLLLNTRKELENFYIEHRPEVVIPNVNFATKSVVVALSGTRPTTGYKVMVDRVKYGQQPNASSVYVQEVPPTGIVAPVLTRPYTVVIVDWKLDAITSNWEKVPSPSDIE